MTATSNDSTSPPQQPTADEIAGMKWWNLHKKLLGLKESTDV